MRSGRGGQFSRGRGGSGGLGVAISSGGLGGSGGGSRSGSIGALDSKPSFNVLHYKTTADHIMEDWRLTWLMGWFSLM